MSESNLFGKVLRPLPDGREIELGEPAWVRVILHQGPNVNGEMTVVLPTKPHQTAVLIDHKHIKQTDRLPPRRRVQQ